GGRVPAAVGLAREVTGVDPGGVEPIGTLPPMPVVISRHLVTPVPAWWTRPSQVAAVDHAESVDVFRLPVAELLAPRNRAMTVLRRDGEEYRGPAFTVDGRLVWGVTGLILSRMFDELGWAVPWDEGREVVPDPSELRFPG
ncbi:coenzyme A pyrophosphatase, partial [Agromyces soli]